MSGLPSPKKRKVTCVVCGEPVSELSDRFCSTKCRNIYINQWKFTALIRLDPKLDSLDTKLKFCKENGITYADYQKLQTLGEIE